MQKTLRIQAVKKDMVNIEGKGSTALGVWCVEARGPMPLDPTVFLHTYGIRINMPKSNVANKRAKDAKVRKYAEVCESGGHTSEKC